MLLANNHGVTIYKNSQRTIATLFSNKVSLGILVLQLLLDSFTEKQVIVTSQNKDHYSTIHWSKHLMP